MKKIIFFVVAFMPIVGYCQNIDKNRTDYSPYGYDYSILNFSMNQLAAHGQASQITYFDLNFVDGRMQDFMKNEMGMAVAHFPVFGKEGGYQTLTIRYVGQATIGTSKIQSLYFKYTLFDNREKHTIIKSLSIYGSSNKVIYFYASYWPTTVNFDGLHNKIAFNYLLQDKATIKINPKTASWYISVENNTIHNMNEYYACLNNSQKTAIKLENKYSLRKKTQSDSITKAIVGANVLRDSLIAVADGYQIPYGQKTNLSPDIKWLRSVISTTEKKLKNGENYNYNNIDGLIDGFNSTKIEKDVGAFQGKYILKIDDKGYIIDFYSNENNLSIPNKINNNLKEYYIGKRTNPFIFNNKAYPSYKVYDLLFMPTIMNHISFREANYNNIIAINP